MLSPRLDKIRTALASVGLLIALLAGQGAEAQTPLPAELAAAVDRAVLTARGLVTQDTAVYGTLNNPALLETKRRQAQESANVYLAATINELLVLNPAYRTPIIERATASAPEARNAILSAAATISTPQQIQTAAVPAAGNWYSQPALAGRGETTPAVYAQTGTVPAVPLSWYGQGSLNNYGAPRYPQPPLPQNVAEATPPANPPIPPASARKPLSDDFADIPVAETNDPIEPANRAVLAFNDAVDFIFLKPLATLYSFTPNFIKQGLRNVLLNLRAPVVFGNDVIQLTFKDAARTFDRFVINSTIGVAGLWDPAEKLFNIPRHSADFGQTLFSYGVGSGPYLVLPLLGPSNIRDGIGLAVDAVMDPWSYFLPVLFTYSRVGATVLATREELLDPLDELKKSSLDWYASLRSAYNQKRAAELKKQVGKYGGASTDTKATDDLFDQIK